MGLTSALYTGLSGLNSNQFRIDTIGDNVANVNTTAFKGTRSVFQTQFSQTFSAGTPPGQGTGGTNPTQVGLGSVLGSIQRNFGAGSIETTGILTDLAIEGSGFFIVDSPRGGQTYTRDGAFKLSASNYLVDQNGGFVQGYAVDSEFNIIPGTLRDLEIPLGSLATSKASTTAQFDGNLNPNLASADNVGTRGTIITSQQLFSDAAGTVPVLSTDLLTSIYDPTVAATPLFSVGTEITLNSVEKGGRRISPPETFTVTAASTLADFLNFFNGKAAIQTDAAQVNNPGWWISDGAIVDPGAPPAVLPPGWDYMVDLANRTPPAAIPAGTIIIESNIGGDNEILIGSADITSTNTSNTTPFEFLKALDVNSREFAANGESVYTSFVVYDSLGAEVRVDLTVVLEETATSGNTWRFFASSKDDTDVSRVVGSGTLTFDTFGQLQSVIGNQIEIAREGIGVTSPLGVTLDFSGMSGFDKANSNSTMVLTEQDGFAAGSLNGFSIGNTGVITGTFSNGLTRTLGQVALATFANPEGLIAQANNQYTVGPNSGVAVITAPLELGAGRILSGSLELSNVDLSREFIGLITATTGFSAASRIISTSNELLNELLMVAR
ncbi:MAG: flagellar hook-basal body complex protein [Phycisphaerae bacterium]|nr:flagellar hook-basal body complex protein [Phycisphaerae bacterium]